MCKRSGLPSRDQVINDSYYEEQSALSGERDLKRAKQNKTYWTRGWLRISFLPKTAVTIFVKKSCFSINLLLFSSSHFQKSPRTSLFSSKKVLAPSTCLCEKVLARSFFSGTSPCPLLLTATLCSNEFCVVPQGRSVFRRTSLMDGSSSYDQHQLEEPRYGLSI